ncbi:hypothetical protein BJ944DRAFT_155197 [Cunninghamella echinulata]|nr:hypothetical protein BJ944DRAFT_155197 [Cunninghamella echinulata]
MNDSERYYYKNCQNIHQLEFISYRNELAMLSVFKSLLHSRIMTLKQPELDRENLSTTQQFALIYRDGQDTLYKNTLAIIEKIQLRVLNTMKLNIDDKKIPPEVPFNSIKNPDFFTPIVDATTFIPLESVTITLKQLLNNDPEFNDVIEQLFENIMEEEDVVFMLALIRESTKEKSIWQPFLKKSILDSSPYRDEDTELSVQDLYESLFPAFSDAFPTVFDTQIYSLKKLLWAENIISNYTVDNPLVVVPL